MNSNTIDEHRYGPDSGTIDSSTKALEHAATIDVVPAEPWVYGELLTTEARPAAEKKLVRLLDMRLMPIVVLIYVMNYIDVSDLGLTSLVA